MLDCRLAAVGLIHYTVTGPYWKLITSTVKYLDLYQYFHPMHTNFSELAVDASSLMQEDHTPSIIPNFSVKADDQLSSLTRDVADRKLVQEILQKLFGGFLAVTDRQLADFLPGGCYHDFSMFTKRNASLHHRSLTNMMKRNKPMSSWLNLKSPEQQKDLLALSAKEGQPLRSKHKEDVNQVLKEMKSVCVLFRNT